MTFWNTLKNIFLLLVLLNVAPLLLENIKSQYQTYFVPSTQVGLLIIKGSIIESTHYNKALTTFFNDDNIKAILLKIESSDGAPGSCQALFNEIIHLKKEYPKPIVTLIENTCTGGGYYIATATDYIVAAGTSIVGGIGTQMFDQGPHCVEPNTIPESTSETSQKKPTQLALDSYQQIVQSIATQRKLSLNAIQDWAAGNIFNAHQGLTINLVDQLGSMHQATQMIRKKGLIEGAITWANPPTPNKLYSLLAGTATDDDSFLSTCAKVLKFMPLI